MYDLFMGNMTGKSQRKTVAMPRHSKRKQAVLSEIDGKSKQVWNSCKRQQ